MAFAQSVYEAFGGHVVTFILGTLLLAMLLHFLVNITKLYLRKYGLMRILKDFPMRPGNFFVGNLVEVQFDGKHLRRQAEWTTEYQGVVGFSLGPFIFLELNHPTVAAKLLNTAEPKDSVGYAPFEPWIGEGLVISTGAKWFRNRRLLTPAFHFDVLKPYVDVFNTSAHVLVNKWNDLLETCNSLEMYEHISLMTLDSLLKCIFGVHDMNVQLQGCRNQYIQSVYTLSTLAVARYRFLPFMSDWIYYLSPSGYKFRKACRYVHGFARDIIQRRKDEKKCGVAKTQRKYLDFLDILLDARDSDGNGLTVKEIQNEVDTFMLAGHDTTASGMSWCLYNLARHPEFQNKCRQEIIEVMGDRSDITWDDMSRLNYLTMCIKESLRLHAVVTNISRETTKPLTLPDGRVIPSGVLVGVAIYAIHHHPDVWENPEVYDPERFSPENSKDRLPHAFIPFSAGPRNCIGQNFAMHEMRTALSILLKHFKFELDESKKPPEMEPDIVLRSQTGIWLKPVPISL